MLIILMIALRNVMLAEVLMLMVYILPVIAIIMMGIAIIFRPIDSKVEKSIGNTIAEKICDGIGYLLVHLFLAFWNFGKWAFGLTPRVFNRTRNFVMSKGKTKFQAYVLASLVTFIFWLIII